MTPMDKAWLVLKMPVYDTNVPGIRFVTQGENEDWTQDESLHGGLPGIWMKEGKTFDSTEREIPHESDLEHFAEITNMTPNQFLQETGTDEMVDDDYYKNLMQRAIQGKNMRFVMPRADYVFTDSPVGHDGRHRMRALQQLGYGDTPVPVFRPY